MSGIMMAEAGSGGGPSDKTVTPAVNWADVSGTTVADTTAETLSGFTGTILIHVEVTDTTGATNALYSINAAAFVAYGTDFTITSGQTLKWRIRNFGGDSGSVAVYNVSDSGNLIDSFSFDLSGSGGGGEGGGGGSPP